MFTYSVDSAHAHLYQHPFTATSISSVRAYPSSTLPWDGRYSMTLMLVAALHYKGTVILIKVSFLLAAIYACHFRIIIVSAYALSVANSCS